MRKRIVALALGALSAGAQAKIDLRANEQPLPVTVDNLIHRRWRCWPATTGRASAATRILPVYWPAV